MRLNKLKIADLKTPSNVFSAPLAGYTNAVFRQILFDLGAGLTFCEMVSAKGLYYGSEKTKELLKIPENYGGIKACQLFGSDPEIMYGAAAGEDIALFDLIDINMGCPMPKIFNNGEGSALMDNFPLAEKIIKAVKRSGKAVSVKFRTGLTADKIIASEFAKLCEGAGADMICVHGRTRDKIYAGEVDFDAIAAAKKAVKIPVIANGGVFNVADAERLFGETGADGIMIARGALYKPQIFAEIAKKPAPDKRRLYLNMLKGMLKEYGERFAVVYTRKMVAFSLKGEKGAAEMKVKLFNASSPEELENLINVIYG